MQAGCPARLVAKMNSLIEPQIIQALYRASQAGVDCQLIVRGICALKPGLPGVSENIAVRSIVGRFLEHTRAWYFLNAGEEELFLSSADWMERNFFRRIEVMFPIVDPEIRQRLLSDLDTYLSDNTQAWQLESDGVYERIVADEGSPAISAQSRLLAQLAERS